ncbi:uracil-DNA glycosylase family protein [Comamonas endophytica]|uniref:DNA polymerase n=1 Tax=Comamonas endophytica TaxID=2949090 RepID=A0ABY6G752_9BURK|nr:MULTISPECIES: uracil-DNA glycosylase family protein [unclassified Acidovorax]MCD2512259.1 hypothetical protein [Acidovorax sp. D4N7]UYG50284.1 hypothetical protein M9799_09160 [Acidovorax sp. 5MLIR]
MALNLDARQRAMLQEMGITVWQPGPVADIAGAAPAMEERAAPRAAQTAANPPPRAASQPAARPPSVQPAPAAPQPEAAAALGWRLHPARPVYGPGDATDATADAADGGWLILLEHPTAQSLPATVATAPVRGTVLEGDAARLLDNMLRALRLHRHPRVWSAALERDSAPASSPDCMPLDSGLRAMVQQLQPARVLVLGLAAARAVLGRTDALGRLRAEPHQVAGRPAVVTYDPGYLLRAAHAKPAAWADLCRAQALGRSVTAR